MNLYQKARSISSWRKKLEKRKQFKTEINEYVKERDCEWLRNLNAGKDELVRGYVESQFLNECINLPNRARQHFDDGIWPSRKKGILNEYH